jgi:hypothetical protein
MDQFRKRKGKGKEREKGNAWLVVHFTVSSSLFVPLYLSFMYSLNKLSLLMALFANRKERKVGG